MKNNNKIRIIEGEKMYLIEINISKLKSNLKSISDLLKKKI